MVARRLWLIVYVGETYVFGLNARCQLEIAWLGRELVRPLKPIFLHRFIITIVSASS
jgi:hypothetical protein